MDGAARCIRVKRRSNGGNAVIYGSRVGAIVYEGRVGAAPEEER